MQTLRVTIAVAGFLVACDAAAPPDDAGPDSGSGGAGGSGGAHADAGADTGVPGDPCNLPPEPGSCQAYIPRYHHEPASGTCVRFIYGGCGGNENNFESLSECEQACSVEPRSEACEVQATDPSLPGVRVRIEADRCRLLADRVHAFHYTIQVDEPIAYTAPDSGGACGRCAGYTNDPLSLVDYAIEGNGLRYCECDVGCCPPTTPVMRTLQTGSFDRDIEWPGREWNGPSDTSQPIGPPFPPGNYQVTVRFAVPDVGEITAALPIEVFDESSPPPPPRASCEVDGVLYRSGEGGIPDPSSCNTCNCFDGELACTDIACPDPTPCPAGTSNGRSCAQCGPTDACEIVSYDCLPSCDTMDDCADAGSAWFCGEGVCRNVCG